MNLIDERRLMFWLSLAALAVGLYSVYPVRNSTSPPSGEYEDILFMYPQGSLTGPIEKVIEAFESESRDRHARDHAVPQYRVVAGQHAERGGSTRFLLATAGGTPPDVLCGDQATISDWMARGAFLPLDAFIAQDARAGASDSPDPDRYYPGCRESVRYRGRTYAVALGVGNCALFYNRDMLEKAGLVYTEGPLRGQAKPPTTWDEVTEYCVRLTKWEDRRRARPERVGFEPLLGAGSLEVFAYLNEGGLLSNDGSICTLNGPRTREALEFLAGLYERQGGVANVKAMNLGPAGSVFDPFIRGKVAMKLDYQWVVNWQAAIAPNMRFGVAPLPTRSAASGRRSWGTGWQAAIPAGARNSRGAWELLRFLASDRGLTLLNEYQRKLTEANGRLFVPTQTPVPQLNELFAHRYVRTNPKLPPDVREAFDSFQGLLDVTRFPQVSPVYNRLRDAQNEATERVLYGAPAEPSLSRTGQAVQAVLDRHLRPPGIRLPSFSWLVALYVGLIAVGVGWYGQRARRFRPTSGWRADEWRTGPILASPWLLGAVVFTIGPILYSFLLGFCSYDIQHEPRWVGLQNYRELFLEDPVARRALLNTLFFMLSVPVSLTVSLGLAILLDNPVRLRGLWQSVLYMPVIVPMVASALAWVYLLNPRGPINDLLGRFGVNGPNWLHDPNWSKPGLILMSTWTCGSSMIVWLAGLKGVPPALYEAAALDGANAWQRLIHITLPHLKPYLLFNLLTGLIAVSQYFGESFVMTEGGPDGSTLFLNYHLFNLAFRFGRMGYASALAWVLFFALGILTLIQFRLARRWRQDTR